MDVNLRLFSERLRWMLADEEGTLPDAAKQHVHNLQTQTETLVSLLTDFETDLILLLYQLMPREKNIDRPDVLGIVEEINNLVRESEKVIDTSLINIMQHKSESYSKELCDALLQAESKIFDIKQQIQQLQPKYVSTDLSKFRQAQKSDSCSSSSSRFVKDEMEEELLDILIEGQPSLSLVAILDSFGFNKNAFAEKAYYSIYVKNYFDCCAWVCCGFDRAQMLHDIMKYVMPPSALREMMGKDFETRKATLHDYLRNKRYLIVFEQVWHKISFENIRDALPDYQNGSRAVIIFMYNHITALCQWENGEQIRPDSVLARGSLRAKYQDFPFIIFNCGSKSLEEYSEKMAYEPSVLQFFSIMELPFHLKVCLLYFSVFPASSEISTRKLYQLWISEGFISENSEKTAEKYLNELINRGFIQVNKRSPGAGTIKACSLHTLTWGVIRGIVRWTKFINNSENSKDKPWKMFKRLTTLASFSEVVHSKYSGTYLHSYLCFPLKKHLSRRKIKKFCERFKLLRVLDMGALILSRYPAGLKSFFYLRYLKLDIPSLKVMPVSLCNLLYLQSLHMPSSYIDQTPDDFWKMHNLRHLNFGYIILPDYPGKYCIFLENLNFISSLHPSCCTNDILSRLPNLQNLRIFGDFSSYQFVLFNNFCEMSCLESLKLVNKSSQPFSMVLGKEYNFLKALMHLSFSNTELKQDPMPTLEELPNLQVLKLKQNSYLGRKLTCGSGGFKQLKILHLK